MSRHVTPRVLSCVEVLQNHVPSQKRLCHVVSRDVTSRVLSCVEVMENHLVKNVTYSAYVKAKGGVVLDTQSGQKLNFTVSGVFCSSSSSSSSLSLHAVESYQLFIMTKHNMQNFRVSPFFEL